MNKSQDPVRVAEIAYINARRAAKRTYKSVLDSDPTYIAAITAEWNAKRDAKRRAAADPAHVAANAALTAAWQAYEALAGPYARR
jgi:hypothetical protein